MSPRRRLSCYIWSHAPLGYEAVFPRVLYFATRPGGWPQRRSFLAQDLGAGRQPPCDPISQTPPCHLGSWSVPALISVSSEERLFLLLSHTVPPSFLWTCRLALPPLEAKFILLLRCVILRIFPAIHSSAWTSFLRPSPARNSVGFAEGLQLGDTWRRPSLALAPRRRADPAAPAWLSALWPTALPRGGRWPRGPRRLRPALAVPGQARPRASPPSPRPLLPSPSAFSS